MPTGYRGGDAFTSGDALTSGARPRADRRLDPVEQYVEPGVERLPRLPLQIRHRPLVPLARIRGRWPRRGPGLHGGQARVTVREVGGHLAQQRRAGEPPRLVRLARRRRGLPRLGDRPGAAADEVRQRADQPPHRTCFEPGRGQQPHQGVQPRVRVRPEDRAGLGDLEHPGVAEVEFERVPRPVGQPRAPAAGPVVLRGQLGVDRVVHQVQQLALARYVGVERHRGTAEPLAHRAHRQRGHAVLVRDRDRGGHDRVDAQPRPGPGPGAARPVGAPQQGHRTAGVALSGKDHHLRLLTP